MEKTCIKCGEIKDITEFNKNKRNSDGYNNTCRVCTRARSNQYYTENKEKCIKDTSERKKTNIKINQQKMLDYFKENPCIGCGESDPIVLEFDHKDGVKKTKGVGKMILENYSWARVEEEIGKCDVRCANCHRRRTAKQQGWYKGLVDFSE